MTMQKVSQLYKNISKRMAAKRAGISLSLLAIVGVSACMFWLAPARADHIPGGLVGYWRLNEGSGSLAADSSGHGNDGTIVQNGSSPAWVSPGHDGTGSALEFDGTGAQGAASNSVNLGNDDSLDELDNYTISIWVKFEPGYVGNGGTWANLFGRNSSGANWAYMVYVNSSGHIRPHHRNSNGTFAPLTNSATVMPVGEWVHIEQVADGSNLRLYINGEEDPNFPIPYSGTTFSLPSANNYIGQDAREFTPLATIGEVKVFNEAINAPGGVRNGIATWQKANDGGSTESQWYDSSGNSNNTSGSVPLVSNGINFNPAYDFTGNRNFVYGSNLGVVGTNNFSSIAAYTHNEAATGAYFGHTTSGAQNNFWAYSTNTGASGAGRSGAGGTCGVLTSTTETIGIPRISGYSRAFPSITGQLNGGGQSTGTCSNSITGTNRQLGKRVQVSVSEGRLEGLLGEFVHYNRDLTTAELNRINSYLAIKYGVTLDQTSPQNYTASDGTTAPWDGTANAAYRHRITGIGRDDSSALMQKQSKSVYPQALVTIGHGTIEATNVDNTNDFADDLSFLMFGDDNAAVNSWIDTGIPALDTFQYKRIPRTWKVQKTGDIDPVAVSFEVDNPNANIPDAIDGYYLINLTKETVTPLIANSPYTAQGVEFDDGDLFTIGTSAAEYNVQYRKTVDPVVTTITPGQTFTYTVTAENIGNVPVTGQSFTDNLSDVVDDATFENDLAWDVGTATWNGSDEISWTGDLNVGQTATITYSFTMNDPVTGDGILLNGIVSPGPDSNCTEDPAVDPDCFTVSPLPIISSQKTLVSPANPQAGDVVNYEFTATNTGGAAASNIAVADDLTGVLDDAVYNGDHSASSGSLSYNPVTRRLSWNGSLAANGDPGDTVTVTFSVTVNGAGNLDDAILNNALISSDCPNPPIFDTGDPDYEANCVTSTPVAAWIARKTVSPSGDVDPGDTVSYTIEVENTGAVDLTGGSAPSVDDDLTDVLDDATFNNDQQATTGTPTFIEPTLNWTGDLNAGQTATITYSATVNDADNLGNRQLANTIAGPMNCPSTPTTNPNDFGYNPDCSVLSAIIVATEPGGSDTPGGSDGTGAPDTGLPARNMLPFSLALAGGLGVLTVVYRKKLLRIGRNAYRASANRS